MTISRELMLAILSMDSYNRGYGVGLRFLNPSNQLGNATIGEDALTLLSQGTAEAAGFYAIAYELPAGYIDGLTGTVISYRGTNFDPGDSILNFFNSPLWQDIRTGWSVGAGWPAMLSANHPAVAANDNQMDAGLERAFRFGEARTAA